MVGLSGCGDDPASPDAEAAATRAQMAWDSAQQQYKEVEEIERRLVRRCLAEQGFQIFPEDAPPGDEPTERQRPVSPDLTDAARVGYGLDPRRLPKVEGAADNSAYAKTPDSYKSKLTTAKYGPESEKVSFNAPDGAKVAIPRAGCLGEVRSGLFGDLNEYIRLSFTASNLVRQGTSREIEGDAQVQAALDRWRTCVQEAGYPDIKGFADMKEKARQLYKNIDPSNGKALDAALATEIKIATAEATCTKSAGLDQAVAKAQAEGFVESLAKYEADMVAWNAMVREALKKGQEMLKA
ncbi:hypothetical protein ABIH81_06740 [Micromonospora sp. HUAS YX12]|uniref:Lipoprotein n=1 Tax=Micromonospora sp. HUAS YX12 TaxID=3156396 RepID=A0AAU7R4E5_9ACTN